MAVAVAGGAGSMVLASSSPRSADVTGARPALPSVAAPRSTAPGQAHSARPGSTTPGTAPSADRPDRGEAVRDAQAALRTHATAIHAADGEQYHPGSVVVDPDGARHVRFERTYRGLAVLGGDFVVHAYPDGAFRAATVAQSAPVDVDPKPAVSARTATVAATARFTGTRQKVTTTLVIDAADGDPVLAWRVVVAGERPDGRPSALNVIIDARTGAVRRAFDDVRAAASDCGAPPRSAGRQPRCPGR